MNPTTISVEPLAVDAASTTLKETLATVMRFFHLAARGGGPDDAEQVHQLRVSTRRAATALELFQDFLPRRATRSLHRKLSVLRKAAGTARDFDVFAARFEQGSDEDVWHAFRDRLQSRRAEGQVALSDLYEAWDHGERIEQRALEVVCAIRPRRAQAEREEEAFAEFAPRALRRVVRRFCADWERKPKSLKRLHAFRIRVKGLRYCLELLAPGLPAERLAGSYAIVKKLAQKLGKVNDHATAELLLEQLLQETDDAALSERLEQAREAEREALSASLARFKKWWSRKRQRRLRKRLQKTAEGWARIA